MVKSHVHYMDHKHYTDIMHAHSIYDPGHAHNYTHAYGGSPYFAASGDAGFYWASDTYESSKSTTGIVVNSISENEKWRLSTESRYIGNESVNRQNTESNDTNAIENRPKNFTIKVWKRTA